MNRRDRSRVHGAELISTGVGHERETPTSTAPITTAQALVQGSERAAGLTSVKATVSITDTEKEIRSESKSDRVLQLRPTSAMTLKTRSMTTNGQTTGSMDEIFIGQFTASKDAHAVGTEPVGGVTTTHYRGTLTLQETLAVLTRDERPQAKAAFAPNYRDKMIGVGVPGVSV